MVISRILHRNRMGWNTAQSLTHWSPCASVSSSMSDGRHHTSIFRLLRGLNIKCRLGSSIWEHIINDRCIASNIVESMNDPHPFCFLVVIIWFAFQVLLER